MPTLTMTDGMSYFRGSAGAFVPVKYNNKLYVASMRGDGICEIINLTDKSVTILSGLEDANALTWKSRLIDWKIKTNSTVVLRGLREQNGHLLIDKAEFDLDTLDATRTNEKDFSLSWLDTGSELDHSTIVPPRLVIIPDKDTVGNLHYVDLESGDDDYWDTGFGSYTPWPSPKFVVRNDDIYMALGKHLAGAVHMYVKLYDHTIVNLESSGGGSPRPMIGGKSWFYNELLFPLTSGGVVNQDNDIFIYDDSFTKIATIDIAGITGWSNNDAMCGFNIYAKKSGGGYYMLLGVMNNAESDATKYRLYHVELNSSFGVTSSTLLTEKDWRYVTPNLSPDYSDWCHVPIVDHNDKKMYIFGRYRDPDTGTGYGWIAVIDLSDIWDNIEEWNKSIWHLGVTAKIATILTLTVTPL